MAVVTVSPQYRIAIPKAVREQAKLEPGRRLAFLVVGRVVKLVPLLSLDELQGIAPGINIEGSRDEEDRY